MMPYSVHFKDWIFVKGLLSFSKNMSENVGKYATKNGSSKYSQKRLDHAKQSARDGIQTTLKRVIQKITEATNNFIGNNIPDKISKFCKTSPYNCLQIVENENDKETPKERHISSEERYKN